MSDTNVVVACRFSYAETIFEAKAVEEGGEKKYSVSCLIKKTDKAAIKKLNAAIEAAKQQGLAKWGKVPDAKIKLPLRDGDEEKPDDEAYAGHFFFNATSRNRPGVVDANLNAIVDRDELKSGDYGRVEVNFYPFDAKNKGVAAGLNNVQKLEDGESLSGKRSAAEVFGEFDDAPVSTGKGKTTAPADDDDDWMN